MEPLSLASRMHSYADFEVFHRRWGLYTRGKKVLQLRIDA